MKASLPSWLSGLFIIVVVPFFFLGGPDALSPTLLKNAWNFGHILFFAVLMLLIQSFKPLVHWQQWLLVTLIAIVIGSLIEFIQGFVGRSANVNDVLHNVYGVWLGLFWGQKPTRSVWLLRFLCVLLVLPGVWKVMDSAMAEFTMRNQFPRISSFENRSEFQQLRFSPAEISLNKEQKFYTAGNSSLHIRLGTQRYSGFRLVGPYGDWGQYSQLSMDFYNPGAEPFELVLRVSDYRHDRGANAYNDRFNRRLLLSPGWNHIGIATGDIRSAPQGRSMIMDEISGLGIFTVKSPVPREFYLDNIRLQ